MTKILFDGKEVGYVWIDCHTLIADPDEGESKMANDISTWSIKHQPEEHPELKGADRLAFIFYGEFLQFEAHKGEQWLLTRFIPLDHVHEIRVQAQEPDFDKEERSYSKRELENGK